MFLTFLGIVSLTVGLISFFFNVFSPVSTNYMVAAGVILLVMGQILTSTTYKKRTMKRMKGKAALRKRKLTKPGKAVNAPHAQTARQGGNMARTGGNVPKRRVGFLGSLAGLIQHNEIDMRLKKVKQLFNDGLITKAEYEERRRQILSRL